MKCPCGHTVGTYFGAVSCGPDVCAESLSTVPTDLRKVAPPKPKRKSTELAIPYKEFNKSVKSTEKALAKAELPEDLSTEAVEHIDKMKRAIGRYEARKAFIKTPDLGGKTAEEVKDFVQKRLDSLTPDALARVEVALKLGDDDVSLKAAYEILDRSGFGKKEGGGLPGAPIIIQMNGVPTDSTTTTYRPAFMTVDAKKDK